MTAKIVFWPENQIAEVEKESCLLDVLLEHRVDILSLCGGVGECETCVAKICLLSPEKNNSATDPESFDSVLACQYFVTEDILVFVPDWRTLF